MKIATFNVNGLRARMPIVLDWLEKNSPVVLCMQETKVQDSEFPEQPLIDAGYHVVFRGQKAYAGVAIVSPGEPEDVWSGLPGAKEKDEPRLICATFDGVPVVNTYVPQGREPDSEWFAYKLNWYARIRKLFESKFSPRESLVWSFLPFSRRRSSVRSKRRWRWKPLARASQRRPPISPTRRGTTWVPVSTWTTSGRSRRR